MARKGGFLCTPGSPLDPPLQNVIVVCKKYYLEVVLKEIDATVTYECVMEDSGGIVDRHVRDFFRNHHIRASVDALCRDGTSEISRDPRTKRLQTR